MAAGLFKGDLPFCESTLPLRAVLLLLPESLWPRFDIQELRRPPVLSVPIGLLLFALLSSAPVLFCRCAVLIVGLVGVCAAGRGAAAFTGDSAVLGDLGVVICLAVSLVDGLLEGVFGVFCVLGNEAASCLEGLLSFDCCGNSTGATVSLVLLSCLMLRQSNESML